MYSDSELYDISPKLLTVCAKCGREGMKKKMYALYLKQGGYSTMRILCHICPNCMPALLDELEVSMPI